MRIGVPREIKPDEYRVALTPAGVRELVDRGHEVTIERSAGEGSGIPDDDYARQGAHLAGDAQAVFRAAELIVKVKEPQPPEVALLEPRHTLFCYLHLAFAPELTAGLAASGAACIAYETVADRHGQLVLLAPMSEVAGKIAAQAGAFMLQAPLGGAGILIGGVPGVAAARVLIIGGGVVGQAAAEVAIGMGADTLVFDRSIDRLRELDAVLGHGGRTRFSTTLSIERELPSADLVIGAVLIPGARAPRVITCAQLALMKRGAVLVDVSIDQGGCFESSRPTTHSRPTYEVDGVVQYCVTNMPGAVPITSTAALTNASLPYLVRLAEAGVRAALAEDDGLLAGLNVAAGAVTHPAVARAQGVDAAPPDAALAALA
jgi:alanine dehydrogenase